MGELRGDALLFRPSGDRDAEDEVDAYRREQSPSNQGAEAVAAAVRWRRTIEQTLGRVFARHVFVLSEETRNQLQAGPQGGGVPAKLREQIAATGREITSFVHGLPARPEAFARAAEQLPGHLRSLGSPLEMISRDELPEDPMMTVFNNPLQIGPDASLPASLDDPTFTLPRMPIPSMRFRIDIGVHVFDPIQSDGWGIGVSAETWKPK